MPQFDISTFASQIFWLTVCMLTLYLFMKKVSIPRIHAILELRKNKINSEMHKSDELRVTALNLQTEYEKVMAEAKVKSNEMIVVSLNKTAIESASQRKEINQTMAAKIMAVEDRISIRKLESVTELRQIATAVASAVVQKVVQLDVPEKYLDKTLSDVLEEKRAS